MFTWSTAAPAISATFLASLVEVVEAFTIVLAVATLRGWRPAALGTAAALGVLGAIVLILGPLLDRVPLHLLQQIGRAHVRTPVTNAHLVCRLLLEKKKNKTTLKNKP